MRMLRPVVLLLGLALVLLPAARAQGEEEGSGEMPKLWFLHFDQVDPGRVQEFEEAGRAWVKAFSEADMGADWSWVASSGPNFTYVYGSAIGSFGMLDMMEERQARAAEAIGAETYAELEKMIMAPLRSHHSEIVEWVQELSYQQPKKSAMSGEGPASSTSRCTGSSPP